MDAQGQTFIVKAVAIGENPEPGTIPFFPLEVVPEARLSPADVRGLATKPSSFYARLTAAVGRRLSAAAQIPEDSAFLLARQAGVLASYLFFDRSVRWQRLVERFPDAALSVPRSSAPEVSMDLLQIHIAASSSFHFNQDLIARIAPAWGIPVVAEIRESAPKRPAAPSVRNNNFSGVGLGRRILRRMARGSGRFLGRIPNIGLAYASDYFLDAWVVGPGRLSPRTAKLPASPPLSEKFRMGMIDPSVAEVSGDLVALLVDLGVSPAPAAKLATLFSEHLRRLWPTPFMEGAAQFLEPCRRSLRGLAPRPLVFSDMGDTPNLLMLAAAKAEKLPIIAIQHAAHYGFTNATAYTELEYPVCDTFITWGWSRLSPHPAHERLRLIPLPTPWLSERAREWRAVERNSECSTDILLMTDKFLYFPPTAGTNRLSRNDFVHEFAVDLRRLIDALVDAGMAVLHKPFDASSAAAMRQTSSELEKRHGSRYRLHGRADKGLTPELVASCRLILWDEPGSGFFECLAAGFPTMLYWPRIYSEEEDFARPFFSSLEAVGIAHRSVGTLITELQSFRANPTRWAADSARRRAIQVVCREYAWTEDDWGKRWRDFVDCLV